jgi:decaprenylphospho-beta-D-erythro-pentofuranosid-2-ulose 2-reductase
VIDSLGKPQSLLLVGGTSEIGLAIARELSGRLQRLVLAGRDTTALQRAAQQFADVPDVQVVPLDLNDPPSFGPAVAAAFDPGDVDVVVLAAGMLGSNAESPELMAQVNYVGPVCVGTLAVERMRRQGHGVLVVLSSVAAERPRADNYLYGSTKAGLDAWANGLADALVDTGVRVLVVRPGMVRTRMSAESPEAPLTCEKEDVARAVAKNLVNGPPTIWVPGQVRYLMSGLRHLPRPVFRKVAQRRG